MERLEQSRLGIARLVLEADSALSISTGSPDGIFDSALVRDANGLAAIPGSSLTGVLRHLWREEYGQNDENRVFGFQDGKAGAASPLTVSWGALLNSQGQPAEGLILEQDPLDDPLYRSVLEQRDTPVTRDRVRLSHKGAAADQGKFDRAVLPAGHRFAVELRFWMKPEEGDDLWRQLLALLVHPGLRLGGATRAGLGRMKLVSLHQGLFDLADPESRKAWLQLGRGLADTKGLAAYQPEDYQQNAWKTGELNLEARGLWRIGQGDQPLTDAAKPADLLPKTEERIVWKNGQGRRKLNLLLLPASSLKGALAHRMAFHARRLAGQWAEDMGPEDSDAKPTAVEALLGSVKDDQSGRAGALFIDDAWLAVEPEKVVRLMHNAIDRFTGGVRDRMLFEEESLLGGALKVRVSLNLSRIPQEGREDAKRAFQLALDDLCEGRLALGSRTSTGNGFFNGSLSGKVAEWMKTDAAQTSGETT